MTRTPNWKRWTILFCGLLENLVFSGSIMGWSALNYILKQEGIFEHVCYSDVTSNPLVAGNVGGHFSGSSRSSDESINLLTPSLAFDIPSMSGNYSMARSTPGAMSSVLIHRRLDSSLSHDDVTSPNSSSFHYYSVNNSTQIEPLERNGKRLGLGCPAQDRLLNLAYTLGTFFNGFTAFIWGFLLDRWGLRTVRLIINSFLLAGSLLLSVTTRETSYLTFPAIILLCLGGVPIRIANMQFANLFPKNRSTVITFYSGAFSASAVIFVILKYAYDSGVSFHATCWTLVILSLAMVPFTFLLLPKDAVKEEGEESEEDEKKEILKKKLFFSRNNLKLFSEHSAIRLAGFKDISSPLAVKRQPVGSLVGTPLALVLPSQFNAKSTSCGHDLENHEDQERDKDQDRPQILSVISLNDSHKVKSTSNSTLCTSVSKDSPGETGQTDSDLTPRPPSASSKFSSSTASTANGQDIPLTRSLFSLSFSLHQWWYSWLITYMIMYVGSMNLWLNRVTTDIEVASNFSKIFGIVQILCLVLAPIAGFIMDHQVNKANLETDPFKRQMARIQAGFWPMMFTTSTLTAILICRCFNEQVAIYTSIIFITLLRSFLVAVASAFIRIRFPASHFNKLLGIMSTCGSFVTLLQFPLFVWEAHHPSNALWVNLFNCICTLVAYLNPIHLKMTSLQTKLLEKEIKQQEERKQNSTHS